MEITSVSRRYGTALYEFSLEQNARDTVRADCLAIGRLFADSREFSGFILDPTIPLPEAEKALVSLFEGQADPVTLRFLRFLVSRRRLDQLPAICAVFEERTCEDLGILKVNITAANALNQDQLAAMTQKLHVRYQKQIDAEIQVEPSLIGGFKIQVGDHIQDFTLLTQLDHFEQSVINAKHEHPKLKG